MPSISELLRYADLQMAAEAFLVNSQGALLSGPEIQRALVEGNKHASRFTPTQADAFLKEWEVVAQKPTTSAGFSGTLFRNKNTREYVISLRSTEFIDDYVRDNIATNKQEIFDTGFAWGQLRDMVEWYEGLRGTYLPPGAKPAVTGYSLGGHLATALNLMVGAEQLAQVVTFNGAGVGTFDPSVKDLLTLVHEFARNSQQDYTGTIANEELRNAYLKLKAQLKETGTISAFDAGTVYRLASLDPFADGATIDLATSQQANTIRKALINIDELLDAIDHVGTLKTTQGVQPKQVAWHEIAQIDLDYQMAVAAADVYTTSAGFRKAQAAGGAAGTSGAGAGRRGSRCRPMRGRGGSGPAAAHQLGTAAQAGFRHRHAHLPELRRRGAEDHRGHPQAGR